MDTQNIRLVTPRFKDQCGNVQCHPNWSWSTKPGLNDYDLWFVVSGIGRCKLNEKSYELHRGVLVFLHPGDCFEAEHERENPLTVLFQHLDITDTSSHEAVPSSLETLGRFHVVNNVEGVRTWLDRIIWLQQTKPAYYETEQHGLFLQILAELYRGKLTPYSSRAKEPYYEAVLSLAHEIQADPSKQYKISELAGRVCLSPDYFTRLFKKYIGKPPSAFILQSRIQHARALLEQTSATVCEIADSLGYKNVHLFSRQFSKLTGQSPTDYRKSLS